MMPLTYTDLLSVKSLNRSNLGICEKKTPKEKVILLNLKEITGNDDKELQPQYFSLKGH